jgi:2-desacetyl-2-hydroxyethyl bacteriochlorophyllide A dehydrogenase
LKVCGVHIDGGMREYFQVPSSSLIHGNELGYDALALVEPLAIAAHGVSRAGINKDTFVLVIGAGPIGMGTMEMARLNGGRVIAMDMNDKRLLHCKNTLKIEHCINPLTDNVVESLMVITKGDMPTVVIDATGSKKAIEGGLEYLAHGGVYVLIGLQKESFCFSHPAFHKRETTLMSSRNATRQDFDRVMDSLKTGEILPSSYITDRVFFHDIKNNFPKWLDPSTGNIKAMVEIG